MRSFLVDSHCHLDRLDLTPWHDGLQGALYDAKSNGIQHFLCVSITLEEFPTLLDIAHNNDSISLSVGVHPNEQDCIEPKADELVKLATSEKVVAIGETGLDYFRSEGNVSDGDLDWQHERLRQHIAAAKQCNKPLIIHNRESTDDTLKILKQEGADEVGGVMHCFVEDWETAKLAMDLNFLISFSGIVTFKSAKDLKEVAKRLPLEKMLVETDSPYLAPMPYRGKSNHPAYVKHVAECIAELRNISLDEVAEQTTENFYQLFTGAKRPN